MINILIVDNHPIVRAGLEHYLNSQPDFEVVGSLSSGVEIFDFVKSHKVDVVVTEIDLPQLNGITALRAVRKEDKSIRFLILSHQLEEIYALSSLKAGASGYLNKTAALVDIATAVRNIAAGKTHLSQKMDAYAKSDHTGKNKSRLFKKLSTREVEVLKLLCVGKKNKQIAEELQINEKTVSTYKARLYRKLNVDNLVDLVHQAKYHNLD